MKKLEIIKYRKLKNIELEFSPQINAISGTNGTCKTSILHLISNSFQAANKKCDWVKDNKCLSVLSNLNAITNPKVESLTRGDKQYNDPARDVKGSLFSVEYFDREPLEFRRHNSSTDTRYAVKPKYKPGTKDTLPFCPIVYLGLSRLFPYGEFNDDESIKKISKNLPEEYKKELSQLYKYFTNYTINYASPQKMGNVKTRTEFTTDYEGIDSNTISAGEDNLSIILIALITLKYYYDSIQSSREVESILLIDELDATLHPAFQIKLLQLFKQFSNDYKIQIVFTTHSMTLLEEMFKCKNNVIYLIDNISDVIPLADPNIYKIQMHLKDLTQEDIYIDKKIPVFTEDDEARILLEMIFNYFIKIHNDEFRGISSFFHMVCASLGSDNLVDIFSDSQLLRTTMGAICVLDGDKPNDLSKCIISLPGSKSPEQLLIDYAKELYDNDDDFWRTNLLIDQGYTKIHYQNTIMKSVEEFELDFQDKKANGISTKGLRRAFNKKLFKDNKKFFEFLFKHWLNNPVNQDEIEKFYKNMKSMFKKVSIYNGINPNEWK